MDDGLQSVRSFCQFLPEQKQRGLCQAALASCYSAARYVGSCAYSNSPRENGATWFVDALATREAEFRFSANSALYMLVFGSFSPKIHLQNLKKKKISFSSIFLKTLPNVWQTIRRSAKSYFPKSESLPKGTKKAKKIRKFAERDKKGEKKSKSMPNSDSSLEFC